MSEKVDGIDDAVAVIPAFDQESGAWNCEYCGNDLYSACPTCAIKQIEALTASLAEAREQLKKYEGCVEVVGSISGAVGVYFSTKEMSKLYGETVGQPVTVWVKKR